MADIDNNSAVSDAVARTVNVGDIVTRETSAFDADGKRLLKREGKVVYVHPKGRFHVVEFSNTRRAAWCSGGAFREIACASSSYRECFPGINYT